MLKALMSYVTTAAAQPMGRGLRGLLFRWLNNYKNRFTLSETSRGAVGSIATSQPSPLLGSGHTQRDGEAYLRRPYGGQGRSAWWSASGEGSSRRGGLLLGRGSRGRGLAGIRRDDQCQVSNGSNER